jgi:hypothetical protein
LLHSLPHKLILFFLFSEQPHSSFKLPPLRYRWSVYYNNLYRTFIQIALNFHNQPLELMTLGVYKITRSHPRTIALILDIPHTNQNNLYVLYNVYPKSQIKHTPPLKTPHLLEYPLPHFPPARFTMAPPTCLSLYSFSITLGVFSYIPSFSHPSG